MEEEKDKNDAGTPEKKRFREPFVLLSMICLMLLCGITLSVETFMYGNRTFDTSKMSELNGYYITLPVIGILLITILSEYKGRKPALITLAAASVLSTILHIIPNQEICGMAGYILQGVVRGGIFSTTFLAISEFCSPKHRFAYLIANMAAFTVGMELTSLLNFMFLITIEKVYPMLFVLVVLEVVCLAVVSVGPESPYWLARRGRVEESRRALLWLRGEGSEEELSSLLQQQNCRGPLRLFWLPLLCGITASSVTIFSSWLSYTLSIAFDNVLHHQLQNVVNLGFAIVFLPIIKALSCRFNHKSIFVGISLLTLGLISVFAGWLYFVHGWIGVGEHEYYQVYFVYFCRALLIWGPCLFGVVLCMEVIPPEYNTYVVCGCVIYYHILDTIPSLTDIESCLPINGLAILSAALSLFCVNVFFFLAHETKGKMLLDIQKLYMPRQIN